MKFPISFGNVLFPDSLSFLFICLPFRAVSLERCTTLRVRTQTNSSGAFSWRQPRRCNGWQPAKTRADVDGVETNFSGHFTGTFKVRSLFWKYSSFDFCLLCFKFRALNLAKWELWNIGWERRKEILFRPTLKWLLMHKYCRRSYGCTNCLYPATFPRYVEQIWIYHSSDPGSRLIRTNFSPRMADLCLIQIFQWVCRSNLRKWDFRWISACQEWILLLEIQAKEVLRFN